jgi:hypothetical protein
MNGQIILVLHIRLANTTQNVEGAVMVTPNVANHAGMGGVGGLAVVPGAGKESHVAEGNIVSTLFREWNRGSSNYAKGAY